MTDGQHLEHYGFNETEDCCVGADAKRQRHHSNCCKSRIAPQGAKGVADVLVHSCGYCTVFANEAPALAALVPELDEFTLLGKASRGAIPHQSRVAPKCRAECAEREFDSPMTDCLI